MSTIFTFSLQDMVGTIIGQDVKTTAIRMTVIHRLLGISIMTMYYYKMPAHVGMIVLYILLYCVHTSYNSKYTHTYISMWNSKIGVPVAGPGV